jgi:hypothetical protein
VRGQHHAIAFQIWPVVVGQGAARASTGYSVRLEWSAHGRGGLGPAVGVESARDCGRNAEDR